MQPSGALVTAKVGSDAGGQWSEAIEQSKIPKAGKLFGWGRAERALSGTKPDKQQHVCFPQPILPKLSFTKVSADVGVFAALTNDGRLLCWGSERQGFAAEPAEVVASASQSWSECFVDVAAGDGVVYAISRAGVLADVTAGAAAAGARPGGATGSGNATGSAAPPPSTSLWEVRRATRGSGTAEARLLSRESDFQGLPQDAEFLGVDACGSNAAVLVAMAKAAVDASGPVRKTLYSRGFEPRSNGHGDVAKAFSQVEMGGDSPERVASIDVFALGTLHGAAADSQNHLWVWGANKNGELGMGDRKPRLRPVLCTSWAQQQARRSGGVGDPDPAALDEGGRILHIACTRGQPNPKNDFSDPTGEEGPRCQISTVDGGLWIAGACHKGLGADHLYKIMKPRADHLSFYRVGGAAADAGGGPGAATGAFEPLPAGAAALPGVGDSPGRTGGTGGGSCGFRGGAALHPSVRWRAGISGAILAGELDAAASHAGPPRDTGYLSAARIVASAAAHIHSFALAEDGRLFGWGCGSDGRLGLRAFFGRDGQKRLMKCYVSTPTLVEDFPGCDFGETCGDASLLPQRVVSVAAGKYWSFAVVAR